MGNRKRLIKIAYERIDRLMSLAEEEAKKGNWERVKRYVYLARRIAMKMRIKFPKKWKRRFCKKCLTFWIFGKNARVRVKSKRYPHIVITCLECGKIYRIPMIKEKKEKRRSKWEK
ncbi:RNAse P, Rpr2/Rpp21 subunit [Methanocaldococcus villosus KIN24-T80]|uniref:Ribonuclease P protein component 4 n=1 Tax=Methanocaldococcus villosus KIN24-T80 TaxID=1069083 RepID=N6VTG5_9EURY|nr:ribonuclease P protein component 4 [Methanocaldococcus villosus]ENN96476.1 RNAse P, Rpr2/Rpp21 subunit [Methanocaldococcus villosus KIN24-T80]